MILICSDRQGLKRTPRGTDGQRVMGNPALGAAFGIDMTVYRGVAQGNTASWTAATAVAKGCMAERGYVLVAAGEAESLGDAFAATAEERSGM